MSQWYEAYDESSGRAYWYCGEETTWCNPAWTEHSDNGTVYYFNEYLGESRWEKPAEAYAPGPGADPAAAGGGGGGGGGASELAVDTEPVSAAELDAARDELFAHYQSTLLTPRLISRIPLLAGLSSREATHLVQTCATLRCYHAEQRLWGEGESTTKAVIVAAGVLALFKKDKDLHDDVCVRHTTAGSIHCADALVAGRCYMTPCTALAYEGDEWADLPDSPLAGSHLSQRVLSALGACHVVELQLADIRAAMGEAWILQRTASVIAQDSEAYLPVFLQRVPFLQRLPPAVLQSVARVFLLRHMPAGTAVLRSGSPTDALFVFAMGAFEVRIRDKVVASDGPGGYVGEMGLLQGMPAGATVIVTQPSLVLLAPRRAFLDLLERVPKVHAALKAHMATRQAKNVSSLRVPLLQGLSASQLQALASSVEWQRVPPHSMVQEDAQPLSEAIIVAHGRLLVAEYGAEPRPCATGTSIAEAALHPRQWATTPAAGNLRIDAGDAYAVAVRVSRQQVRAAFVGDPEGYAAWQLLASGVHAGYAPFMRVEQARVDVLEFLGQTLDVDKAIASELMQALPRMSLAAALVSVTNGQVQPGALHAVPATEAIHALNAPLASFECKTWLAGLPLSVPSELLLEFIAAVSEYRADAMDAAAQAGHAPEQALAAPTPALLVAARSILTRFCPALKSGPSSAPVLWLVPTCTVMSMQAVVEQAEDGGPLPPGLFDAAVATVLILSGLQAQLQAFWAGQPGEALRQHLVAAAKAGAGARTASLVTTAQAPPASAATTSSAPSAKPVRKRRASTAVMAKSKPMPSQAGVGGSKARRGQTPLMELSKLNRFGKWQPRQASIDLDAHLLLIYDTAGSLGHKYKLEDLKRVERVLRDPAQRQVRLVFSSEESGATLYRFSDSEEREQFCLLIHTLQPDIVFTADAERADALTGRASFEVAVDGIGGSSCVLTVDPSAHLLLRHNDFDDMGQAQETPVSVDTLQLVSSLTDARKLRLVLRSFETPAAANTRAARALTVQASVGMQARARRSTLLTKLSQDAGPQSTKSNSSMFSMAPSLGMGSSSGGPATTTLDVVFPTHASRERFAGQLRLLMYGLDAHSVRALGLQGAGYVGHTVGICAGTWNLGGAKPPKDPDSLSDWLSPGDFDVYAVGLQEAGRSEDWCKLIEVALSDAAEEPFQVLASVDMMEIHLFVFARASLVPHISNVHTTTVATGIGGMLGNKGGVGLAMTLADSTHVAFVASHLAARKERLLQRADNFADICSNAKLRAEEYPTSMTLAGSKKTLPVLPHSFDHVIWMGDLNYRIDCGDEGTRAEFDAVVASAKKGDISHLQHMDQLVGERELGRAFFGFNEARITFPPTYRMQKGSSDELEYSNKRNQNPSWCDRVLARSRHTLAPDLRQLHYRAHFQYKQSDHRPVSAGYDLSLRPGYLFTSGGSSSGVQSSATLRLQYARVDALPLPAMALAAAHNGLDVPAWFAAPAAKVAEYAMSTVNASHGSADDAAARIRALLQSLPAEQLASMQLIQGAGPPSATAVAGKAALELGYDPNDSYFLHITGPALQAAVTSERVPTINQSADEGALSMLRALNVTGGSVAAKPGDGSVVAATPFTVAEWHNCTPDILPVLSSSSWLASEHILVSVRRKNGALLGTAEVPIAAAASLASSPEDQRALALPADKLELDLVLRVPILRAAMQAFSEREMSGENLAFVGQVDQFRDACLAAHTRLAAELEQALHAEACGIVDEDTPSVADTKAMVSSVVEGLQAHARHIWELHLASSGQEQINLPSSVAQHTGSVVQQFMSASPAGITQALCQLVAGDVQAARTFNAAPDESPEAANGSSVVALLEAGTADQLPLSDTLAVDAFAKRGERGAERAQPATHLPSIAYIFHRARAEVCKLLSRDTLKRFRTAWANQQGARARLGTGAMFCVPLLRNGQVVGTLSGVLGMETLDAFNQAEDRISALSKSLARAREARKAARRARMSTLSDLDDARVASQRPDMSADAPPAPPLDARMEARKQRLPAAVAARVGRAPPAAPAGLPPALLQAASSKAARPRPGASGSAAAGLSAIQEGEEDDLPAVPPALMAAAREQLLKGAEGNARLQAVLDVLREFVDLHDP